MICPSCQSHNDDAAEACFTCGKALFALTHGIVLAARYEVLRPLGAGGMGRVYKAHDRVLDEDVAIKVLRPEYTRDPEMARRFRSEIKLARKASHHNVCRIHEYGEDAGLCFISMEYIEGVNVKEYLEARSLSHDEAYDLVLQIAQGLRAVHEHGIIHRDFKASNIMVDGRGVVKLMDFGIAKEAAADTTGFTGSGVIGTPEYMSPEQGAGGKVDFRSDIYSLGCVVFEVFAGRPPFRGETPLATLYMHQREPPPVDVARIPDSLVHVLRVALAKDPAGRYESVAAFIDALREARGAHSPGAAPPSPETTALPTPLKRRPGRIVPRTSMAWQLGPWVALAALAVGVVAATGGSGLWRLPTKTQTPPATAVSPTSPATLPAPTRLPEGGTPAAGADPRASTATGRATAAAARAHEPAPPGTLWSVTPSAPPDPSPQPATPTPEPPAGVETAEGGGTLTLLIVPEAEVTVDGRSIGRVSMRELRLAPGSHTVRVLHPDYEPLQRKLTVREGVASKLVLDLAEKGIRKSP